MTTSSSAKARRLPERVPDMLLAGEAGTANEARQLVDDLRPQVVPMDLQMPGGGDATEATRAIVHPHPSVGVIVLTTFEDDESVFCGDPGSRQRRGSAGRGRRAARAAVLRHRLGRLPRDT